MADKHVDEGKGRLKEAADSLTGDNSLKNEGKIDQAKSTVKDNIDKVAETLTGRKRSRRHPCPTQHNRRRGR